MKLKTILPVVAVAGVLMCEPAVLLHAGTSDFASPEAMGWFRKKKKSETKDSVQSKSDYEKLTGSGAIARKGMFNVYQKKSDYYFEVPARLLGRDMLVVNKLQRVPSELNEAGVNRGTNYENQMVRFELDKAANKLLVRQSRPLPLAPDEYNPQNEMFWHFRTKCSFPKTKRTSLILFLFITYNKKASKKNVFLRCFLLCYL